MNEEGRSRQEGLRSRADEALRVSLVGLWVNLVLTALKGAAALLGGSVAMAADAAHSLSDFATDIVAAVSFRFAARPVDASHSYGHGKVETLAAAVVGLSLAAVAAGLFWTGAGRVLAVFRGGSLSPPGMIALAAAVLSIVVKEWLFRYTKKASIRLDSQALLAKAWDHRSDALSSVGTFIGIGGAIALGAKGAILDPLASLVVALAIVRVAWSVVRGSLNELLEASLSPETEETILALLQGTEGVEGAHHLRTRRIGPQVAIDVHVLVAPDLSVVQGHDITINAERRLRGLFGDDAFVSIHVEPLTGPGLAGSPELDDGHDGTEEGPPHHGPLSSGCPPKR
jgi:cation diffusion facilitator family transporter